MYSILKGCIFPIIIVIMYSCSTLPGTLGISDNINESKNRNVFIQEMKSSQNFNYLFDSLKTEIEQIWIEHSWRYDKNLKKSIIVDGYQMHIKFKNKHTLDNYHKVWGIGWNDEMTFRKTGESGLMCDLQSVPKDTLFAHIQVAEDFFPNSEKKIIDKIFFVPYKH